MKPLNQLSHVHILGIGGTLMGAFASFLKRQGIHVTGSDKMLYPPISDLLKSENIPIFLTYHPENLLRLETKPDLIVVGNVISKNNLEMQAVLEQGLAYTSLPEALEELVLKKTINLVVAGTHGKTTTSSMLVHVLEACGQKPHYLIGGVPKNIPYSFQIHQPPQNHPNFFVLEGDEYDTSFWDKVPKFFHYQPNHVLLTSIEFDHADIYQDLDAVEKSFEGLIERIRPPKGLIACTDYPSIQKLLKKFEITQLITYSSIAGQKHGFSHHYELGQSYTQSLPNKLFPVTITPFYHQGKQQGEIALGLPGRHNALNALAVFLQAQELGFAPHEILKALSTFEGVKRRLEVYPTAKGVWILDDFAHHPTAVRETIQAVKTALPHLPLLVAFEPRSATSRKKIFQKDYIQSFAAADEIFIAPTFQPPDSKTSIEESFSSEKLVADLKALKYPASLLSFEADLNAQKIAHSATKGSCILVLSNGSFNGLVENLCKYLS